LQSEETQLLDRAESVLRNVDRKGSQTLVELAAVLALMEEGIFALPGSLS
jgi:hypothetical protein